MREVFIFVGGATPQIITETIYALARRDPPVHPDAIYVITTSTGRELIRKRLKESKALDSLSKEYSLPPLRLDDDSFIVAAGREGRELDDIRDESDNEIIADLITAVVRDQAQGDDTRLHCSISGGRKTMSFYLGAALQLFGRPQDRLYHVLVSPEFESNPNFFYKPKKNRVIESRNPDSSVRRLNTRDAEIGLAELPFVRLRDKLGPESGSFRDLVAESQSKIDTATIQPEIAVDLERRTVATGPTVIGMSPAHLMIYAAYLRKKLDGCVEPGRRTCGECTACFGLIYDLGKTDIVEAMVRSYCRMYRGKPFLEGEIRSRLGKPGYFDTARQTITKINGLIRGKVADEAVAGYCVITSIRKYGDTRYGIRVDRGKIRIS